MSRKMIDYKVENGTITSIDGYSVGGGDELTGDALMGITKDSTTITRTLDTDGKVKLDINSSGDGELIQEIESGPVTLEPKQYSVGEFIKGDTTRREPEGFIGVFLFKSGTSKEGLPSVTIGDAVFIPYCYLFDYTKRYLRFGLLCIKAGTVATRTHQTTYIRYVKKA